MRDCAATIASRSSRRRGDGLVIESRPGALERLDLEHLARGVDVDEVVHRDRRDAHPLVGRGLDEPLDLELAKRFADGDEADVVDARQAVGAQRGARRVLPVDERLAQLAIDELHARDDLDVGGRVGRGALPLQRGRDVRLQ